MSNQIDETCERCCIYVLLDTCVVEGECVDHDRLKPTEDTEQNDEQCKS